MEILEQLGSDDLLLFSTDWPHYHYDTPADAFPLDLSPAQTAKILRENARAFYKLY